MQNLSDNDLDNIFRKAAEELKPQYDATHWNELKSRLDQEKPRPGFLNRNVISIVALCLMVGSLSTVYYFNTGADGVKDQTETDQILKPQEQVIAKSQAETPNKTDKRNGDVAVQNTNNRTPQETATTKHTTIIPDTKHVSDQRQSISETNTMDSTSSSIDGTPIRHHDSVKPQAVQQLSMPQKMNHRKDGHEKTIVPDQVAEEKQSRKNTQHRENAFADQIIETTIPGTLNNSQVKNTLTPDHNVKQEIESKTMLSSEQRNAKTSVADSLNDTTALIADSLHQENETNKAKNSSKSNQPLNRISVKLALSPDFSSVGYSGYENPGTNYGILGEYHLNTKWSILTGAIWSKKLYSGENLSYSGIQADRTDGDCRILDIPLNITYTFNTGKTMQFYASAGISSYIMNEENYVFHYDGSYGEPYTYSTTIKGKNNELFSILNISLGVQKQISSRWAIQLEPFVKHSLSGIGEGDLSLNSIGGFLNLRYSFLKINNP
ncbi:MAG TPA: outer membrane beta-barrel protein [Ohtaekwangia sp.]|nr:outer membrane beta-barrel protein [Ohtaekwangia sp.]